ncbi:MAG: hypothetical protein ABIP48_10920 [Planctomycetota bacterium]
MRLFFPGRLNAPNRALDLRIALTVAAVPHGFGILGHPTETPVPRASFGRSDGNPSDFQIVVPQ